MESRPAATLILLRDSDPGFEVLMIERAATMSFAAGALAFPGGRVDEDDRVAAADPALVISGGIEADEAAARVCAIRETLEEVGILIGCAMGDPTGWRAALGAGALFSDLLREAGTCLDLGALTPFARWCPKLHAHSYDTRFYLARVDHRHVAKADGYEAASAEWVRPARPLAGAAPMLFPTRRNLERLDVHSSIGDLVAHALATPVTTITPHIVEEQGERFLCIPEGLGYPVLRERLATALRL